MDRTFSREGGSISEIKAPKPALRPQAPPAPQAASPAQEQAKEDIAQGDGSIT
jgi:hypothetical protein